ncbi:MAG: FAD-dependent oxidoreductase, partial [Planctomycetota bacterium]
MSESFDVVVIGSGPGGYAYAAAIRCAQRGATVAVVEKNFIGGTCLNCGCIPSKALLASAHTLLSIKHAALMGVDVASATANWAKMQQRKDAIVAGFRKGLTGLIQSHKVNILPGRAVITAPGTIKIEAEDSPIQIQAGKIILATGSEPIELPALPFDGRTVISSKEALGL